MAYDYYCTECGQVNNANTVLFDMDPLLKQNKSESMHIVHLRFTEKQLVDLIESGDNKEGQNECTLVFEDLMRYLSDENNMNISDLRKFTYDEARKFAFNSVQTETISISNRNDYFGGMMNRGEPKLESNVTLDVSNYPLPIQKMLEKSKKNQDEAHDITTLMDDFRIICNLFDTDNHTYHFTLAPYTENDDKGDKFITGYWINGSICVDNARICHRCHKKLFYKAGTAEHRVISFIGETSAGKTSTILSLTHYALYGLCPLGDSEDEAIWKQNGVVNEARKFTNILPDLLYTENSRLMGDLEWFKYGIAPVKTEANEREDAYHSTMLITNSNDGRKMIISLMDLPGELFIGGKVNKEKVCNEFSAALSSSAYIICFDTTKNINIASINHLIDNAVQMQELRKTLTGARYYVPSMILFSKADGASSEILAEEGNKTLLYMLRGEDNALKDQAIYMQVKKNYQNNNMLRQSYYGIMRCGAFGYNAPNTDMVYKGNNYQNKDAFGKEIDQSTINKAEFKNQYNSSKYRLDNKLPEAHMPTPSQVDLLMQWILQLTGCLPMTQEYHTKVGRWKPLINYYLDRVQYRAVNPGYDINTGRPASGNDEDVKEGMARQILFCNPGKWDVAIVESLSVKAPTGFLGRFTPPSTIDGHKENIRAKMKNNIVSNA